MQKLFELLEKHELAQHLMNDKEFVEGAKKILKEDNIEVDENKLGELMKKIEEELCKSKELKDEQLANVSGGTKGDTVLAISTITGTVIGAALGGGIFGNIGGAIGTAASKDAVDDKGNPKWAPAGNVTGGFIGSIGGASGGGALGFKIGKLICKKYNLK